MSDSYRPRPDDHLVEPVFAGLGVGEPPEQGPRRKRSRARRAALVLLAAVALACAWWLISAG